MRLPSWLSSGNDRFKDSTARTYRKYTRKCSFDNRSLDDWEGIQELIGNQNARNDTLIVPVPGLSSGVRSRQQDFKRESFGHD